MDILDIPTEERNFLTLKKAIEDLKKEKEKQTKDNSELKKENEKLKKKIAILDDMEIPKEKISSTVQTNIDAKDEEMEMTGTQSLPLVEGKITPPHQIIDKTLKVQEDDMQMTCRIVTDAIPKSSINQPIDATNFGNDDMEMTTSHSVLAQKFGSKNQAQNTAKKLFEVVISISSFPNLVALIG